MTDLGVEIQNYKNVIDYYKKENKRLCEALENAQSEIIPIRGYEQGDVNSITSVCIKIRKVLDGEYWE